MQFYTGAFVSGEPVQPLVLRLPHTHMDISWVQGLPAYAFRVLTQWVNTVNIIWLPVYVPSPEERADARLYANNVQRAIADAMELPPERVSATFGVKELKAVQSQHSPDSASARARAYEESSPPSSPRPPP